MRTKYCGAMNIKYLNYILDEFYLFLSDPMALAIIFAFFLLVTAFIENRDMKKHRDTPLDFHKYNTLKEWWKMGIIGTYKRSKLSLLCYIFLFCIILVVTSLIFYCIGYVIYGILGVIWIFGSGMFEAMASDGSIGGFVAVVFMFVFVAITILYIIIIALKNF